MAREYILKGGAFLLFITLNHFTLAQFGCPPLENRTVNATGAIGCNGETVTLTATAWPQSDGVTRTFEWWNNAETSKLATTSTGSWNVVVNGNKTYKVRVIDYDGSSNCGSDFFSVTASQHSVTTPTISGPIYACNNGSSFSLSASPPGGNWSGNGINSSGTFNPSSISIPSGQDASLVNIIYSRTDGNGCTASDSHTITVYANVSPGSISGPSVVCYNTSPGTLTNQTSASGGGSFSYQWQKSPNGSTSWTNISGAVNATHPAEPITSKTYFRRKAISQEGCGAATSNIISVDIHTQIFGGIIEEDQVRCNNSGVDLITSVSRANIGNGTITYHWETSNHGDPNQTWLNLDDQPELDDWVYLPLDVTGKRYYRRATTDNCTTKYSNIVSVEILETVTPGTISDNDLDKDICEGENPGTFRVGTAPEGGDGTYTYQWYFSHDNSSWSPLSGPGANTAEMSPGPLFQDTYFHRVAISHGCPSSPSNSIRITVHGVPEFNFLPIIDQECGSTTASVPDDQLTGTVLEYYWQTDELGESFTYRNNIVETSPGGNGYYLRAFNPDFGCWSEALPVLLTVFAQPQAPVIDSSPECQKTVLSYPDPPSLVVNYWQPDATSKSKSLGSQRPIDVTEPQTYFLRATLDDNVNVDECWSPTTSITVVPDQQPVAGQANLLSLSSCETLSGSLQVAAHDGSVQQWWKRPINGTWQPISGSTNTTYDFSSLTEDTEFRCEITKNNTCATVFSGTVNVFAGQQLNQVHHNFITSTTMLQEGITNPASVATLPDNQIQRSTNYFDGLGRPLQNVTMRGSPDQNDIVQPFAYDEFSRQSIEYLPYADSDCGGRFRDQALDNEIYSNSEQYLFYQNTPQVAQSTTPFAEKKYDNSPLNRVVEKGAPGEVWQPGGGHTIRFAYGVNTADEVRLWSISTSTGLPISSSDYTAGTLRVITTTDEEDNDVKEYTDREGRVVLKKVLSANDEHSTYYIYDDIGNLRFVLPPEASSRVAALSYTPDQAFLNTWAFQYQYDGRNRMVEKRVPGADPVWMVYDDRDRLVLTQDGNQRPQNKWTFTKYDALNRSIITGIYTHASAISRTDMINNISTTSFYETYQGTGGPLFGYTNTIWPTTNLEIQTATYYDNYDFLTLSGWDAEGNDFTFVSGELGHTNHLSLAKGQVTGTITKIIGIDTWLNGVTYYDDRYRVIQVISEHHKTGLARTTTGYDFVDNVLETKTEYAVGGNAPISVHRFLEYDHAGRLLEVKHRINSGPVVTLLQNEYNELGELVCKKLHTNDPNQIDFLQTLDYRYNIRGWLTRINRSDLSGEEVGDPEDYFGMELIYEQALSGLPGN